MTTKETARRPTADAREIARLVDQFERVYAGDAWHGDPLRTVLADVEASLAATHPVPGVHSIWELADHIAWWLDAATRRLGGEVVEALHDEDWPPTPKPSGAAWAAALADLQAAHDRLLAAIRRLGEEDLEGPVPGKDYTKYILLHGLLQHTLYHMGQIGLLKRAARERSRPA
jgi:uncharacterized damage-inducible protein DinB